MAKQPAKASPMKSSAASRETNLLLAPPDMKLTLASSVPVPRSGLSSGSHVLFPVLKEALVAPRHGESVAFCEPIGTLSAGRIVTEDNRSGSDAPAVCACHAKSGILDVVRAFAMWE